MKTYTKAHSTLLLNHAITAVVAKGRKQNSLARDYDIEESRISEAKLGKHKLDDGVLARLEQDFGFPRGEKGRYLVSEHYPTIDEFLCCHEHIQQSRLVQRLYQLTQRADYRALIARPFFLDQDKSGLDDSRFTAAVLAGLDQLLAREEFFEWYACELHSSALVDAKYIMPLLRECGIYFLANFDDTLSKQAVAVLFRLASLKYEFLPDFLFSASLLVENVVEQEFVLVGDEILSCSAVRRDGGAFNVDHPLKEKFKAYAFPTYNLHVDIAQPIYCSFDDWQQVDVQLYLTRALKYHLVITFYHCDGSVRKATDRRVLIENINRNSVLVEFEKIREFMGLAEDLYHDIKFNIAASGGYVPGAKVLD